MTQRLRDLMPDPVREMVGNPYPVVDNYGWLRFMVRVDGQCEYCRVECVWFVNTYNALGALYCTKQCMRGAQRRRRALRRTLGIDAQVSPRACPTPTKTKFDSLSSAESKRLYRSPRDARLHAYRCSCGAWHLGHERAVQPLLAE